MATRIAVRPLERLQYLKRYGLTTEPFSLAINPRYAYAARDQLKAIETLNDVVMGKSALGVCSGHVGLGKTTLARLLQSELEKDGVPVIYLPGVPGSPRQSEAALYNAVISEFGLKRSRSGSAHSLLQTIAAFAADNDSQGSTTVILIDEAQHLRTPALRGLLSLLNLQADQSTLIQIILFGVNPTMANAIEASAPLRSRVGGAYELNAFQQEEVIALVKHRLAQAGRYTDLFTPAAIRILTFASRGVPRDICQIANKSCILADRRNSDVVDEEDVEKAATELMRQGDFAS